jgi:hypothetical protein
MWRAAARATGLDLPAISAEAAVVLEKWPAGNRDVINVMFAPSPSPPPAFDNTRLDDQDKEVLTEAHTATSDCSPASLAASSRPETTP